MGNIIELEQAGTVTLRLYVTADTLYREARRNLRSDIRPIARGERIALGVAGQPSISG
jgi:hypothetical protein